jgi:glucosamine--fructose-6-phosphate aminotransferase (isomerizing)
LKITEVAYLHAQALAAGELKHGPIALLEPDFPVIALVPNDDTRDDMISALKEVKARGARTIVIAEAGARVPEDCADALFSVPATHPWLAPLLCAIPLQLLAYHVARIRGINPDRPRNLAKSVTVK